METFAIEHLTFSYPGRKAAALRDVSLQIKQGEFVTLCGKSGCGKSTLLRQLKTVLSPHGDREGRILFEGVPLEELDQRTQTEKIGFVLQSPENQIVTDKVWHELAFGLESLGLDTAAIRLRVAEMASFFGIQTWFHKKVVELSGGQKQLLNLAAIMAMQPSVLILDEPTSQLDPIAASDFLETIHKINRELGTTILLTEHRLEDALPMSDRAVVMDKGRIIGDGTPREMGLLLKEQGHDMFLAMPTPMRVYAGVESDLECPVTVREGRNWLTRLSKERPLKPLPAAEETERAKGQGVGKAPDKQAGKVLGAEAGEAPGKRAVKEVGKEAERPTGEEAGKTAESGGPEKTAECGGPEKTAESGGFGKTAECGTTPAIELSGIWFKYEKELPDVVKGLSARIYPGELYAVVGGNGTGKTTSISILAGLFSPYRGTVRIFGKKLSEIPVSQRYEGLMGILPQNPQALFVKKTVEADLMEIFAGGKLSMKERRLRIARAAGLCELEGLLEAHPYDLSGGEQQRAALAKVLLKQPRILILDEPTKGLDAYFKEKLAGILKELQRTGVTIVMVSHDIEFCARYADRCAMFFDGGITGEDQPRRFFSGKSFYTTAASRMARSLLPGAVLAEDVIYACGGAAGPAGARAFHPSESDGNGPRGAGRAFGGAEREGGRAFHPSESDGNGLRDGGRAFGGAEGEGGREQGREHGVHKPQGRPEARFDCPPQGEARGEASETGCGISGGAAVIGAGDGAEAAGLSRMAYARDRMQAIIKESGQLTPGRVAVALGCLFLFVLTAVFLADQWTGWRNYLVQFALMAELGIGLAVLFPGKELDAPAQRIQQPVGQRRLSKRTAAAMGMILLAIPFTIYVGIFYLEDRKYYFISMMIILETMLPFALVFEDRKPQARELVVLSVMCAIGVAGRAAFFMLPQFKPVLAVVIIAGVCFGGESGFLVGAVTMFVSNMLMSQGPWTPWQMFAAGIIGFLAGVLFRKGLLRKRRAALCIFGFLAAFFVYGIVMDSASALMWQAKPTKAMFLLSYLHGLPFNIIHGIATAFFLWFISGPFIEKLDRIKVKYGLIE